MPATCIACGRHFDLLRDGGTVITEHSCEGTS